MKKEKCLVCKSKNLKQLRGYHPEIKQCNNCGSQQWGGGKEKADIIYNPRK